MHAPVNIQSGQAIVVDVPYSTSSQWTNIGGVQWKSAPYSGTTPVSDPFVADLASRVGRIDDKLGTLTSDVSAIKATYATKTWIVGWVLGAAVLVISALWAIIGTLLEANSAHLAAELMKTVAHH